MRKFLILLALVFLMPFSYAIELNTSSSNIESNFADLYIAVLKYEPYPVSPGEYFNLWLEIENKGLYDAKNVNFVLDPKYPFFLDPSENANRTFSNISTHSGILVKYKVRVDEKAVEGATLLDYYYTISNKKPVESQVSILIQTIKAILSVEDVKTVPEIVAPGETANITVTLKNNADSYLKYVTTSLQLLYSSLTAESASAATSSFIELPFTPVGGGNEKSVYQIAPNEKINFNFQVVANPDAEIKPYKIPININYFDELGKNYSRVEIVGIIVGSMPDVYSIIDSSTLKGSGQSGEITIKFVNKGTSPIKFLNVMLKESKNYKIVSSSQAYLGKIDSDDYDTATFRIYLNRINRNGSVEIPLNYEYMDGNNKKYSIDDVLLLQLHSAKELGTGNGGWGTIVFAVVIILIIYLVYRRWRKKGKKK